MRKLIGTERMEIEGQTFLIDLYLGEPQSWGGYSHIAETYYKSEPIRVDDYGTGIRQALSLIKEEIKRRMREAGNGKL